MDRGTLDPGKILEMSGSYWMTCTLHAAVKLDLFTAIGDRHLSAAELAAEIDADPRALTMLLNALVALDLLRKRDGTYANGDIAAAFLAGTSPRYVGHMIMHHHHLVESWSHLDQAVKTGRAVRERVSFTDPEKRKSFLMGMFNSAMVAAPRIVRQVDLSGRRHFLDLGGGPGTYAIHFCLENPDLRAVVYDLPTTRPFAEETIARFNLSDRITFVEGDFVEKKLSGSYDAAWLSHVLHGEDPDTCRQMIVKAAGVLAPGGLLMVHEFILDDTLDGPLFPALFSLNMLLGTEGGQAYSQGQIMEMFTAAGLKDIRRIPVDTPGDSGIIAGIVP